MPGPSPNEPVLPYVPPPRPDPRRQRLIEILWNSNICSDLLDALARGESNLFDQIYSCCDDVADLPPVLDQIAPGLPGNLSPGAAHTACMAALMIYLPY